LQVGEFKRPTQPNQKINIRIRTIRIYIIPPNRNSWVSRTIKSSGPSGISEHASAIRGALWRSGLSSRRAWRPDEAPFISRAPAGQNESAAAPLISFKAIYS
jgi:hypothetical protein